MTDVEWIAIDWGTSNLRVWGMNANGRAVREATSTNGMNLLARDQFEDALMALVSTWLDGPTIAIACGMVGARQGWMEAPYSTVPCEPLGEGIVKVPTQDARLQMHILSGIKQTSPADVMRGEETQIAGFLALNKDWDGVICLPGTHTKWVHVSAGEVVSFQTLMTGELFGLLSEKSVLAHSVNSEGWSDAAFEDGLSTAMTRPEALAARLFNIRASQLLEDTAQDTGRARLSGLLIGAELAATKPYWLGQNVAIVGSAPLAGHYTTALRGQGVPVTETDPVAMTLAGLTAGYKKLKGIT